MGGGEHTRLERPRGAPLYIDVATLGASADACAEYRSKGRAIAVTGRLVYHEWQSEDGRERFKHQVIGGVHFAGRPDGDQAKQASDVEPSS